MATALATSALIPAKLRGSPADVALTIMAGAELGISPMASFRFFDVIEGRVGLTAKALTALAQRSGLIDYLEPVEQTAERATWKIKRKGGSEVVRTWTIQMAQAAGLTGKDNWKKYPHRMLSARCKKDLCDDVVPEVAMGMPTVEELLDRDDLNDRELTAFVAPVTEIKADPIPAPAKAKGSKAADKAKPIDAQATETKEPTSNLNPAASKETAEALAKAGDAAKTIADAKVAEGKAADATATNTSASNTSTESSPNSTGSTSGPDTTGTSQAAPSSSSAEPSSSSGDDFGEDAAPAGLDFDPNIDAQANLARFETAMKNASRATYPHERAKWVPLSKVGQAMNSVAPRMREIAAARASELGL